jgi:hypothetical protein
MKDKGHFWCSIIKSGLRLFACIWVIAISSCIPLSILATGLGFAELVGILEEIFDKR